MRTAPFAEAASFVTAHRGLRHLDAFVIDLCGNAIGKRFPASDISALYTSGTSLCAAMQLTDVRGTCWDTAGLGFSDGDPDAPCRPVPGTLAMVPWSDGERAQCLMRFEDEAGGLLWYEPRTVLGQVLERFADTGLTPVVAVELEFYLIDRERDAAGAPQPPRSPVTGRRSGAGQVLAMAPLEEFGPVIGAIEHACRAQGLPVTTISKEYGPGQFEINLAHLPDPLRAADHAALMRRAVVEAARAAGMDATFMSKPYGTEPGSGLQINLSLLDGEGGNPFDPRREDGGARLGHAVAGMQAMLAESMAVFAPSFHAYRRFGPNQFTPVTTDWGRNNRSVAFRIPASAPGQTRIEHRAAGAEANPYLVMATVLAAAHHGIAHRLEPTAMADGNVGEEADPALPLALWSALERMAAGAVLPDYLGGRYVEAYVHAKRSEFDALMAEILPREHEWYL